MRHQPHPLLTATLLLATLLLAACSTKKNTAGSRRWQAFTTRYNVYYNAETAYLEGLETQYKGAQDNFTERLPLYTVGNEKMRSLGKGNFETAVTKCEKAIQLHSIRRKPVVKGNKTRTPKMKAFLSRKEFNPFLKNAWLLMGKAQFQKGEFLEAASVFSYITRFYAAEPEVVAEARVWLARCYAQLNWFYDAEDAISRLNRDSLPRRLYVERDATMADLLTRQEKWTEALPYLQRTAKKAKGSAQRARAYYLLGQVYAQLGRGKEAYKALSGCIRQSPAFQMAFNARIMQTEVITDKKNAKATISRLKRMARSDNNKDYLDQVYYAMGNTYMLLGDSASAVSAYEKGRAKSTRNGIEKGILLLRLGEIYWNRHRFEDAQKCYGEAVGLLDKTYKDYAFVSKRAKVLDELVPHTTAIHLQDSLQALAKMSETERNAAIDRVIEALKKKEKEEAKARADSAAQARMQESGISQPNGRQTPQSQPQTKDKTWYFYNPPLVSQGKQSFRSQWGSRKNEDDWRRHNKTMLATLADDAYDYSDEGAASDSTLIDDKQTASGDSIASDKDDPSKDPHKREYYMAQIPFTAEALAASDALLTDGLYNAGIIEKDKMEDFPLASATLERLPRQYPSFEKMEDVYYHLFLLYSRWGKPERANYYRDLLRAEYPEGTMTRVITDPDFERIGRFGKEMEDSLYTATYDAYRRRDNATVGRNYDLSTAKFPSGANRPKFIFLHALSRIGTADSKEVAEELRNLASTYAKSDVAGIAANIVSGLEAGRTLGDGGLSLGSLWERRNKETAAENAAAGEAQTLTAGRDEPFVFLIAYPNDSIADDALLYDLAHFNFTSFMLRGFDISKERTADLTQFTIAGFRSYAEAHAYAQRIYRDSALQPVMKRCRTFIISEHNLKLLGTLYSYEDYRKYYEKNFAPMAINPSLPLEMEPEETPEQHYEDEVVQPKTDEDEGDAYEETFEDTFEAIEDVAEPEDVPEKTPQEQFEELFNAHEDTTESSTETSAEDIATDRPATTDDAIDIIENTAAPTDDTITEDSTEDIPEASESEEIYEFVE